MSDRFWRRTLSYLYRDDPATGSHGVQTIKGKDGTTVLRLDLNRPTTGPEYTEARSRASLLAQLEAQKRARRGE